MRVRMAVIGTGSMGMNHLLVLKGFDEERALLVDVAEAYELALRPP